MSKDRQGWNDPAGYRPEPAATEAPVTVLVACRAPERARGLLHALQARGRGAAVTGEATGLSRVAACIAASVPDVLLLEHDPADPASRRLLTRVVRQLRAGRVLLLCDDCTAQSIPVFVRLGVAGCVTSGDPGQVARAIRGVHAGQCWFPRDVLVSALRRRVAGEPWEDADGRAEQCSLTPREREVITLVGSGHSNKEIGRLLQISDTTVKTQLHRIYVKLQTSGRYKAFAAFRAQRSDSARAALN